MFICIMNQTLFALKLVYSQKVLENNKPKNILICTQGYTNKTKTNTYVNTLKEPFSLIFIDFILE